MANSILHATIIEKNASGDKTIIYPKNTTKDVLDGSQTLEQTLNTLKSNDISNKTTAFTQAATRQNLASGETIATSHGKIMKLISDLKSLAFLDKVGVANLDGTLTTEYNKRITTDKVTTSTSITSAGYVADARAINSLQNQINTLNSNYTELKKSVADGKNLIGNVVGGNQDSTFQVLANNAQSIKTSMNDLNNQLHAMTMDRNNWMNIANSRIVYRFSNGQLGSQTFAFSKFMRLLINDSSVSEDRLSNYHFLFYRRADRVFIMLPYLYYSAAPPIYHRIIQDGNYYASSLSNDRKTNSFLLSEGVEYEIKGYFKTYASGTDLTGSIFIKSVSGNINVTKVNLNKTAYYGAWTC